GNRRAALDRQRATLAEVVLYINDDKCPAHIRLLNRLPQTQPSTGWASPSSSTLSARVTFSASSNAVSSTAVSSTAVGPHRPHVPPSPVTQSPASIVTGIAGSPAESFNPSQGTATNPSRSNSREAARSGRSGTGSPRIRYGRCSIRSCGAGSGRPRDTTTSSVAVPVGLCRRTAVLRPPIVALCSDRFTTGAPSTSTSLYTSPAVGAPEPV